MGTAGTPGSDEADEADEALMLAYSRGDAAAFERLYARHRGPTYRYLLRHTSDRAVADELHQDVWMKVVRARDRYAPDARFTTWLYTLARHRLVDHWRSRGATQLMSFDEGEDCPTTLEDDDPGTHSCASSDDPLAATMDAEAGRRLVAALAGVPGPQRDAFLLHVEAGLSLDEIARLAGVPSETIKTRLRYAYRRLRAALEDLT
jgi:RNA polymerase sigma-70 factor (ECF subfamily)